MASSRTWTDLLRMYSFSRFHHRSISLIRNQRLTEQPSSTRVEHWLWQATWKSINQWLIDLKLYSRVKNLVVEQRDPKILTLTRPYDMRRIFATVLMVYWFEHCRCCIKLNPSRRSRKAATSCHRPATNHPPTSRQPPAACRQPPLHLKVEISCFEFVYK